jgi:hypothetical protein
MKYFKLESRHWGAMLVQRRNTTIHCFKLSKNIMLVWDRRADREES